MSYGMTYGGLIGPSIFIVCNLRTGLPFSCSQWRITSWFYLIEETKTPLSCQLKPEKPTKAHIENASDSVIVFCAWTPSTPIGSLSSSKRELLLELYFDILFLLCFDPAILSLLTSEPSYYCRMPECGWGWERLRTLDDACISLFAKLFLTHRRNPCLKADKPHVSTWHP